MVKLVFPGIGGLARVWWPARASRRKSRNSSGPVLLASQSQQNFSWAWCLKRNAVCNQSQSPRAWTNAKVCNRVPAGRRTRSSASRGERFTFLTLHAGARRGHCEASYSQGLGESCPVVARVWRQAAGHAAHGPAHDVEDLLEGVPTATAAPAEVRPANDEQHLPLVLQVHVRRRNNVHRTHVDRASSSGLGNTATHVLFHFRRYLGRPCTSSR